MIYSVDIKDPKSTPIEWWDEVPTLKEPRRFDFKPGLNVLWGRNGSGKTTLLKLLARLLHCEQAGMPAVTEHSLREMFDRFSVFSKDKKDIRALTKAVSIAHDGQGVRHFDPTVMVGRAGGEMDWDFADMGFANTFYKGSAGQTTLFRFERVLVSVVTNSIPEVDWRMDRKYVNDLWKERLDIAREFMKGNHPKGRPTVLLDEPERSLDFSGQMTVWRFLRAFAPTTQFIIASHSMFALNIPEANYIELEPGFLDKSLAAMGKLPTWADEKPSPGPIRANYKKHAAKMEAEAKKRAKEQKRKAR